VANQISRLEQFARPVVSRALDTLGDRLGLADECVNLMRRRPDIAVALRQNGLELFLSEPDPLVAGQPPQQVGSPLVAPERKARAAASACSLIAACATSRPAPCFTASIRIVVMARNGKLRSFSAAIAAGKHFHLHQHRQERLEQPSIAKNASGSASAAHHRAGNIAFVPLVAAE